MDDKLTNLQIKALKRPGKYFDGKGLYLELVEPGRGYWRLKCRVGGKEKRLAFGVYPEVSLKQARERRTEARRLLADGQDPTLVKREARLAEQREASLTFELVADQWLAHQAGAWSDRTRDLVRRSLELDALPELGPLPMAQIKPRQVMVVVKAVEARGAGEAASRLLQRLKGVFRYAVVHELIDSNPMLDLKPSELLKPRQVRHRAALTEQALPGFLAALAAYRGEPSTVAALRLLMLTAVRPGELRGSRWGEFDLVSATWRVPAERMKMKLPHTVPLSRQALAILHLLKASQGEVQDKDLVFPSPFYPGRPMSENTLNSALARLGYKGEHSAHGFRALFSTVANEHGHDADVIERQLAHAERNEVRAAYHRAAYLDRRRELMQWYADLIDGMHPGAKGTLAAATSSV